MRFLCYRGAQQYSVQCKHYTCYRTAVCSTVYTRYRTAVCSTVYTRYRTSVCSIVYTFYRTAVCSIVYTFYRTAVCSTVYTCYRTAVCSIVYIFYRTAVCSIVYILQDSCMQYSVRVRTHITRQLYTLYNAGCSVQCHIVNGSFIEYSVQCTYGERQLYRIQCTVYVWWTAAVLSKVYRVQSW